MKIPKFKTEKIKLILKNLPLFLGEHAFLTFLGLLVLALLFCSLIFYKYSFLAEKQQLEVFGEPFQFEEEAYRRVLDTWQEKEERFDQADLKEYPDLFREIEEAGEGQEEEEELPPPEPGTEETQEISETELYIISKGETLWELAEKYLGSGYRWKEIKDENGQIFTEGSAEVIPVGQKLIIPKE